MDEQLKQIELVEARAVKSDQDPISAPKKSNTPPWWDGKFRDSDLRKLGSSSRPLPSKEQRQFYLSETIEPGLALRMVVGYGSTKKWSAATYDGGRTVQTPLGAFDDGMGVRVAREKTYEIFRRNPQDREREKAAGTFGEVSQAWYEACVEGKIRTAREVKRVLGKDLKVWENKPHGQIKSADAMKVLDKLKWPTMC